MSPLKNVIKFDEEKISHSFGRDAPQHTSPAESVPSAKTPQSWAILFFSRTNIFNKRHADNAEKFSSYLMKLSCSLYVLRTRRHKGTCHYSIAGSMLISF